MSKNLILTEELPETVIEEILLSLDYERIMIICDNDKRKNVSSVCNDFYFWENKIERFPKEKRQKLFFKSCRDNYIKYVEVLLKDENVDPEYNDDEAFIVASLHDNLIIVKLLLEDNRIDPNYGDGMIYYLMTEQYLTVGVLLLLLEDGRDKKINSLFNNGLRDWMIKNNYHEILKLL